MKIRFLGTHNAESRDSSLVSFLIDDILAVDAGSLGSRLSFSEQEKIRAILLSHGHYDHIRSIPTFAFANSDRIVKVFATEQALEILSSHMLDGIIYPDFTDKASFLKRPVLDLIRLEPFKPQNVENYRVIPTPISHAPHAVGLYISANDKNLFYTGDTGPGLSMLWQHISPQLLIIDLTFPNRFRKMAEEAGHLCPELLERELMEFQHTKGYLPRVVPIHLSPQSEGEIEEEAMVLGEKLGLSVYIAREGSTIVL